MARSIKVQRQTTQAEGFIVSGHARLSVTFPDEIFDALRERAAKSCTSVSEQVRRLVKAGLWRAAQVKDFDPISSKQSTEMQKAICDDDFHSRLHQR